MDDAVDRDADLTTLAALIASLPEVPASQIAFNHDRILALDVSEVGAARLKVVTPSEFVSAIKAFQPASATLTALSQICTPGFVFACGDERVEVVTCTGLGEVVRAASPVLLDPFLKNAKADTLNGIALIGPVNGQAAVLVMQNAKSVIFEGDVWLSGRNTGDQVIALTGAVQGSGTAQIATVLQSGVVGFEHLRPITGPVILGRTKGRGSVEEISVRSPLVLRSGQFGIEGGSGEFRTADDQVVRVVDGVVVSIKPTGRKRNASRST